MSGHRVELGIDCVDTLKDVNGVSGETIALVVEDKEIKLCGIELGGFDALRFSAEEEGGV